MTTIINSTKFADRWVLTAQTDDLVRLMFDGPTNGVAPVFMSVEQGDGSWGDPIRVQEPERFAMRSTASTAVRPAFDSSWVHNFCRAVN